MGHHQGDGNSLQHLPSCFFVSQPASRINEVIFLTSGLVFNEVIFLTSVFLQGLLLEVFVMSRSEQAE
jgi:hypothetical protein